MRANMNIKEIQYFIPQENIYINEPMSKYTSFKIGGPAECLVKIKTLEQLNSILKYTKQNDIKLTVIGNGSNILVSDDGIKGIVAKIEIDNLKEKIEKIIAFKIKSNKEKIFSLNNVLNAHNPINILRKGYAIIEDENGKIIKSKDFFSEDKEIKISMEDGYVIGNFVPIEKGGNCHGQEGKL